MVLKNVKIWLSTSEFGDVHVQWLRGQEEVEGGPKMPIFVHVQG